MVQDPSPVDALGAAGYFAAGDDDIVAPVHRRWEAGPSIRNSAGRRFRALS